MMGDPIVRVRRRWDRKATEDRPLSALTNPRWVSIAENQFTNDPEPFLHATTQDGTTVCIVRGDNLPEVYATLLEIAGPKPVTCARAAARIVRQVGEIAEADLRTRLAEAGFGSEEIGRTIANTVRRYDMTAGQQEGTLRTVGRNEKRDWLRRNRATTEPNPLPTQALDLLRRMARGESAWNDLSALAFLTPEEIHRQAVEQQRLWDGNLTPEDRRSALLGFNSPDDPFQGPHLE